MTLYLWSGTPCAYLVSESIYGFNGKHIGWFRDAVVYDHHGYVVAATSGTFLRVVKIAPLKGLKELQPLRALEEIGPLKPIFTTLWSKTAANAFFLDGRN